MVLLAVPATARRERSCATRAADLAVTFAAIVLWLRFARPRRVAFEKTCWMPTSHPYYVGVDCISLFLIVLTGSDAIRFCRRAFPHQGGRVSFFMLPSNGDARVFVSGDLFALYIFWDRC